MIRAQARFFVIALVVGTSAFVACSSGGGGGGSGGSSAALTPAERMCKSLGDAVQRCGAGPCDQALIDDCASLAATLSDPYLTAAADCMEAGAAPTSCLVSSLSALTPTPAQEAFVGKFCSDCPPVSIPGCEDALLGKGNVPEQLKSVKQVLTPLGDAVLAGIESQCFGGLTCLAELSSCVQQVLVARALPESTVQCLLSTLTSGDASGSGSQCGTPDGGGSGGGSGTGGSGTGGSGTGGSGTGGSGTGGSSGSGGGFGGSGGSAGNGGSSGSAGTGGTGGSGGSSGGSTSCVGYCGGQAPGGCWCDEQCATAGDCCADKTSVCGATCSDSYEPNETSASAKPIDTGGDATLSDCEASQTLTANVGSGNVDWYQFKGVDGPCGLDNIQPHAKITSGSGVSVCVFLKPTTGSGAPKCLKGSSDSSVSGYYGCCGTSEARHEFGSNLKNDEADVLIRVTGPANACVAYSMQYGYGA